MVNEKAQMGNMLHLVIIAVVILIAAMAIILMVTKTTGDVGDSTGDQMDTASGGIDEAITAVTNTCPGDKDAGVYICVSKNFKKTFNSITYCCSSSTPTTNAAGDPTSTDNAIPIDTAKECTRIAVCNPS